MWGVFGIRLDAGDGEVCRDAKDAQRARGGGQRL